MIMQKKSLRETSGGQGSQINSSFFSSRKETIKPFFFQPKLTIGPTDDIYEQEADAVADKIMHAGSVDQIQPRISSIPVQRKCAACEEEEKDVQRKESGKAHESSE